MALCGGQPPLVSNEVTMARASLVDEIATVSALIRKLGLGEVTPAVLKSAHHTTLLISPRVMVARVQSSRPLDAAFRSAVREIAVARHLTKQGAPVIAPLEELAGPYVTASAVVTFWPYVEHERVADEADALLAAETLQAVHQAFYSYDGELPPYTQALDRCWSVLADATASPALSADDRDFLKARYRCVRHDVEAMAGSPVPLHGDAHLGNLLLSDQWACLDGFRGRMPWPGRARHRGPAVNRVGAFQGCRPAAHRAVCRLEERLRRRLVLGRYLTERRGP